MQSRFFSKFSCTIVVLICFMMSSIDADDSNKMPKKVESGIGLTDAGKKSLDESESVLVDPLLQFSSNLFRKVKEDKQNVILSPISIHSALNLLLLGAEPSSVTETELKNVLGYSHGTESAKKAHESYAKLLSLFQEITAIGLSKPKSEERRLYSDDKNPVIDFWTMGIVKGDSTILPNYLEQAKKYYNSSVKAIHSGKSDESRKLVTDINHWAKGAGFKNGVIDQNALERDFSMLLLSAVKVQAYWLDEFYEYEVDELFYNYGLRDKLVKNSTGMTIRDLTGRFFEFTNDEKSKYNHLNQELKSKNSALYQELANSEFRLIEIPLRGDLTFTIFEPLKNGTGEELAKMEEQLLAIDQNSKESKLSKALRMIDNQQRKQAIELLQMPKFKFETDLALKTPLMSLGLDKVFGAKAELTKMSAKRNYVSDAKHQAVIEVDKMGIKAAGITTIHIMPLSLKIHTNPIRLHVKNPYMFVLRYSKVPLFIGHLVHL